MAEPELTIPATGSEPRGDHEPAAIPRTIGRYSILERVGAGASGVVFSAYDPKLDRRVAVKLLKWQEGAEGREALLAEARALARLDHPNVVAVHDVGELEGRAFIAMAFVDGPTLRTWVNEQPVGDWRSRVEVYRAAGRGLAAAHEAGIVHRDFKPDNVLVAPDGTPRVADFGLALLAAEPMLAADLDDEEHVTLGAAGTPAYMAPELAQGAVADERSDQYSFCVSLYEALFGQRPFPSLLSALASDGAIELPTAPNVPVPILRAMSRGLQPKPEDRWPSMSALLAALEADLTSQRNKWLAVGIGAVVIAGSSAAIATAVKDEARCDGGAGRIAEVWNEEQRDRITNALASSGVPFASSASERTINGLEDYASRWAKAHDDACEAHARGEQSGETLDLRMACLVRLQHSLGSMITALSGATADDIRQIHDLFGKLEPVHRCAETTALVGRHPLPADRDTRAEVARLERELSEIRTAAWFRRASDKEGRIAEVVEEAESTKYLPLVARAYLALGEVRESEGDYGQALDAFEHSWTVASTTSQPLAAATAAVDSVRQLGFGLMLFEAAELRARDARAVLERLRTNDPRSAEELGIELSLALAKGELRKPDGGDAGEIARRVVELVEAAEPVDQQSLAQAIEIQGWAAMLRRDFAKALEHYRRALVLLETRVGPDHPNLSVTHNSIGIALKNQARFEAAARHFERALAVLAANGEMSGASTVMYRRNLGFTYLAMGDDESAIEHLDAAFESEELGPALLVQFQFVEFTRALRRVGRVEDAEAWLEASISAAERDEDSSRQTEFFVRECQAALERDTPELAVTIGERGLAAVSRREVPAEDWARLAMALSKALRIRGASGDVGVADRLAREATVILEAGRMPGLQP